jgi:DNA helicase-2/ATP-dependent DNA helicase PcrA
MAQDHTLLDFYQLVLEKTEYVQKLKAEESTEAEARIENLEELSNAMTQFMKERTDASLQSFLEEMALVSDIDSLDEEQASVTMMTLHVSKGLEYPYVFIVGLEENLFPSGRSEDEESERSMEEERRLCYVGMTRARQKLHLTYARSRKVWGQEQFNPPSRFLNEIPQPFVQFSTAIEAPRFVSQAAARLGAGGGGASNWGDTSFEARRRGSSTDFDSQDFPDYEMDGAPGNEYAKGSKVRHPTFGVGTVYQTEGSGEQQKVSVLFTDQTIKKFVAKYARLERL